MRATFPFLFVSMILTLALTACGETKDNTCTDCDDQDPCTLDSCVEGQCVHENTCACRNDDDCDDADACTYDTCEGGQCAHQEICVCEQDSDCDDSNPCTNDSCLQGHCTRDYNTAACDDGIACTENDHCDTGSCVGQAINCDDGNPCTADSCDNGECTHQEICSCNQDSDCDDDDPCTDDACDNSECTHQSICACVEDVDCDDDDPCTDDACDNGECTHQNTCACVHDSDCDDGNLCTDDDCNEQNTCTNTANSLPCDDDNVCTENDTCSEGSCSGTDICGGCDPVALPEPVPMAPLPGETNPGRSEFTTTNGFADDYIYSANNEFKVGTRQEWGGTIIFFGQNINDWAGRNNTNTIDANDTGREVQVAFYDPDRAMQDCAWDASCASSGTNCEFSITFLGWNPVQGGNRCNRGSGVEDVVSQDGVQTVTTLPLFWNPNWDLENCSDLACDDPNLRERRSDVRVEQRMRFVRSHVVELQYTLTNLGDLNHRSTAQEMPTVYTANGNNGPDLWRLFNSEGTEIAIDVPGNDGFFYKNYSSPGGWSCMQNTNLDYGVGLYSENRLPNAQGWQNRGLPFNNFRPVFPFGLPPYGEVIARSYLILGSKTTIEAEAAWLDQNLAPFGWLDGPTADQSVNASFSVSGWVLDNKGISAMEAIIDGSQVTALSHGNARSDVCLVWPAYPSCPNAGFTGNVNVSGLSACQHLLEIRATDTDGNQRIIARQRIVVTE